MSQATKKKHVVKEVLESFCVPDLNQKIVKVIKGNGNNLHEVEDEGGNIFLVTMPSKFRKNIWILKGNYLLVETIPEGNKVKAEIIGILLKDQIKYLKKVGYWPARFETVFTPEDSKEPTHQIPEHNINDLYNESNT